MKHLFSKEGEMIAGNRDEVIEDLIYELALATSRPFRAELRNLTHATAAVESMSSYMGKLLPQELKKLIYTIKPLLYLLELATKTTYYSIEPISVTAAACIINLMPSRICMSEFVRENGLKIIYEIFDDLFSKQDLDLHSVNIFRSLIENCSIILREVARFYAKELVQVGHLRFCVIQLRSGDSVLKTISAATMALLSENIDICKQLFSFGAIKPLLLASDSEATNEACTLSCIGCITQLCQVPEIARILVKQGALPILVKTLQCRGVYNNQIIHEKSLFGLQCLARIEELKRFIGTEQVLQSFKNELRVGTAHAKYAVIHMLLDIHSCKYPTEETFLATILDNLLDILRNGPWHSKNLCVKAICVLYRSNDAHKWYFISNGVFPVILDAMRGKHDALQEAFLVGLLTLCTHPDAPPVLIYEGGIEVIVNLLDCEDTIVRDLSIVLLKGIALYNRAAVESVVPEHLLFYFKSVTADDFTEAEGEQAYTQGEYIDEFLLSMVENRRDQHYLLDRFPDFEIQMKEQNLSVEDRETYEHTFYELDPECRGQLGITELKMLSVMMGEKFDKEELDELLTKYDADKNGSLDFMEFVSMMQHWFSTNKQETMVEQVKHDTIERGPVAKARRWFSRWINRDQIDQQQIKVIKEEKQKLTRDIHRLSQRFLSDKKLLIDRGELSRDSSSVAEVETKPIVAVVTAPIRETVRDLAEKAKKRPSYWERRELLAFERSRHFQS